MTYTDLIQGYTNEQDLLWSHSWTFSCFSTAVWLTCVSPLRRSIRLLSPKCWAKTWMPSLLTLRRRAETVFSTSRSREESLRPSFLSTTSRWKWWHRWKINDLKFFVHINIDEQQIYIHLGFQCYIFVKGETDRWKTQRTARGKAGDWCDSLRAAPHQESSPVRLWQCSCMW